MKFGYFDDENREYVITTPFTPFPWINYLGTEDFFSLISNTAGGYSFYRDAKLRRLTRYRYNGVPADQGGRLYYIRDGENIWSPSYLPAGKPLDAFRCRHGMGYTVFESAVRSVSARLCCFVPLGKNCEINYLVLENSGTEEKKLQLYAAVEFCLWNAVDDCTNFQRNFSTGEVEIEESVIYHKTEYRERRDHYAFFSGNRKHDGFDSDREAFLGKFRPYERPQTVEGGISGNSVASGWAPIACHRYDLVLAPGEKTALIFLLGYVENSASEKFEAKDRINKRKARELMAAYDTPEKVEAAFSALREKWTEYFSSLQISTGNAALDRTVNIWNQYQCMVTFNISRSASYFESGTGRGIGFRDGCQDLLGGMHLIPKERVRQRLLDLAAIQKEDGSTYHQFQPLTKKGNAEAGIGFNDDPLWLIACTVAYIKETGDSSVLNERVFFADSGQSDTLFEHLRRSMEYTWNHRGAHGLPLIGRADWNDCLNLNCFSETTGESFQTCANIESGAESVFIAGMFVCYGKEYAELCFRFGDRAEGEETLDRVKSMEAATVRHGWDGEWFLRAYDAFGNKVGGKECEEGKIYLEPQGFCAMAGIGGKNLCERALKSAKDRLLCEYGLELLSPPYTLYRKELGEVSSYPPGYKENGAVFCHSNPWTVIAAARWKDGNTAFDLYRRISPMFREEQSDIYGMEPYVYSQMIAGRAAPRYGQAKNSWLTGTASWAMVAMTQEILGIHPDYDGLRICPSLPDQIRSFEAIRKFRGTVYRISVFNEGKGTPRLEVNGCPTDGEIVSCPGEYVDVKVTV